MSHAFYPYTPFRSGTGQGDRGLSFAVPSDGSGPDRVIDEAAESGWGLLELPARHTPRTDPEAVRAVAAVVRRLLDRGGAATSERSPVPSPLTADRIAVGTAHRDQAAAVRAELAGLGVTDVVVDTANRLQGREYDVTVVLHPLSGRPDATAFHLETGRLCVLASRHRHACIVVCRAGVSDLLDDYPSTEPVQLGTVVKFPDGWEANHAVLAHLAEHRVVSVSYTTAMPTCAPARQWTVAHSTGECPRSRGESARRTRRRRHGGAHAASERTAATPRAPALRARGGGLGP